MRLLYLNMIDFMAYSKQHIDFADKGCFVITGENLDKGGKSNGSGKSTIFWAITMCLYNQARGKTLGESIKIGAKSCTLELALVSGNRYFKIQRKRKREGTSTTFLWAADNPDFKNAKDITGNDQTETQNKINAIMKMDYQSFCHSMYFKEDASSIFAQSTKSVRFNIIKNSLQVDRYDRYSKEAKKDLEAVTSELTSLSAYISSGDALKEELEGNLAKVEVESGRVSKLKSMFQSIDSRLSTIQSDRSSCEVKLSELRSAEQQKNSIMNMISNIDKQISAIKSQSKKYNDELSEYRRNLAMVKEEIESLNSAKNAIQILTDEDITDLQESYNNYHTQISINESKIQEMNEKIRGLKIATGSQCWACNKPLSSSEAEAIIAEASTVIAISESANGSMINEKKKIMMAVEKSKENRAKLSNIDSRLTSLENKKNTIIELGRSAKSVIASLDYAQLEDQRKEYKEKYDLISIDIIALTNQVKESIDKKESIDSEEKSLLNQKNNIMAEMAEANQKLGELKQRSKEIKASLDDISDRQSEVAKLWDRRTVIENLLSACSKKGGIPSILISQAICEIEKFANDTLYKFDNFDGMKIKMTMDKPDEIEISVRMGSEVEYRDFDTFSGGERFIISFAIRMALAQVLSRKYGANIKFILLDEAGTALDEYNTARFAEMVKRLSKDALILLITHQNNLKDFIQQNITVRRQGGKSTILMNGSSLMDNMS